MRGLIKLVRMAAIRSGVVQRTSLLEGQKKGVKRNSVYITHGFRKRYTNILIEYGVSSFAVERLLGHLSKNVTSKHYYRPDVDTLLGEYVKAMDAITINEENRLKRKVEQLTVRADKLDELEQQMNRFAEKLGLS